MSSFITTFSMAFYPKHHFFFSFMDIKLFILLSLRFYKYKNSKMHYFFFEFCYWVAAFMIFMRFFPIRNFYVLSTFFMLSYGPLAISFFVFLYRIVYHDLESYTSFYLHLAPCLTSWILRFHITEESYSMGFPTRDEWQVWLDSLTTGGWLLLLVLPMVAYLTWAILYYILIFWVLNKRIEQRQYWTLYSWSKSTSKKMQKMMTDNERHNQFVYMRHHVLSSLCSILIGFLMFHFRYLTFAYTFILLNKPIWSSGVYYHQFFIKKYGVAIQKKAEKKQKNKKDQ